MIGAPCTVPSTKTGEGATLAGVPSAASSTKFVDASAPLKFFPVSSSAPTQAKTTAHAATILDRAREEIASGREESFLVMDMNVVRSQAARWRRELPRVLPLYAVKCQPDVEVIKTLAGEGFGFDVASKREMELVLEHAVPRGLAADRLAADVIYANPCKMASHIRAVSQMGVHMTTLDNVDELRKIHAVWPSAKLVVRILGDDTFSVCQFNKKFGLNVDDMPPLLVEAKRLGMDVVGVSFHVGSGCTSAVPFAKAIESAHRAFDVIEAHGFPRPRFLDLGGGWPGTPEGVSDKHASFEDICALVRPTLDRLFPPESGVKIVAEPGRYFVAACGTLYTAVHARRAIFSELPELLPNQSLHDGSSAHDTDDGVFSAGGLTSPSPAPHQQQTASPIPAPQASSPKARAAGSVLVAACPNPSIRGFRIYINEGTYGCFNAIANDHMDVHPSGFIHADGSLFDGSSSALYECSVWGPTCDSVDLISSSMPLPELNIGDWVEWSSFGAYTSAAVASFNGLRSAEIIHINAA